MEELLNNWVKAEGVLPKFLVIWAAIAPFFYAYLTSFAMLMWKVANRRPDDDGNITSFKKGYLFKDRMLYIASTIIFIFVTTVVILRYWTTVDAVLLGVFVGIISHYLGRLFEFASTSAKGRAEKELKKINPDE
ncbi:MAG: hypothetical protein ACTHMM_10155 [Agriterribacter sp.]